MISVQRPLLLVLGGHSDIGLATARVFASHGHDIILAARHAVRLEPYINDFAIRYQAIVHVREFDVTAIATHADLISTLPRLPDCVLCAVGVMHDQNKAQNDFALFEVMSEANFTGPASVLELIASAFEQRGSGRIIGLSSIAGERGRASNYLYGSTKAAFTTYLEGLQHRLKRSGVRVDIIKPGFVKTRMTEGLDLPPGLPVSPDALAKTIVTAKPDRREIFPNFKWSVIAQIIRHGPNFLFLKSKL